MAYSGYTDFAIAASHAHNLVTIDIDNGPQVFGYVMDDFQYAIGNRFETMFETMGGSLNEKAAMANQIAAATGVDAKQFILRNLNQTVAQWVGSDRFSFQLTMLFLATSPKDDVRVPVQVLQRMMLPGQASSAIPGAVAGAAAGFFGGLARSRRTGLAGAVAGAGLGALSGAALDAFGGGILTAPNGYNGNATTAHGAVGVTIGNWFRTPRWFVCKTGNPIFSKAHISTGRPLYAVVSIALESYRLLLVDEVAQFFPDLPTDGGRFVSYNPTR